MLDIIGDEEKARALYKKVLAADPNTSEVIRLHLIRLLEAADPEQLMGLLNGKADPNKIRDALSSALNARKTFEQSIDFMNAVSKYLEQVTVKLRGTVLIGCPS